MNQKAISLKKFAEQNDITYVTAHRHWLRGNIEGLQLSTGKILVYGWKQESKVKTDEAIIFARVSKGKDANKIINSLNNIALHQGIKKTKTIIWEAFIFQSNPYLNEIYHSEYKYIIVESLSDFFGANYIFMEEIFTAKGFIFISLKDSKNIPNMIYKALQASSNIAKAAVGMHSYKKEIADQNNRLLD